MSYSPISFIAPNFRDYSTWWLKAYEPDGTTPKVGGMALDAEGAVTVSKLQLNADGFIVTAGAALVIPYIDSAYDLWLFPTEAEADANDTSSAIRLADDITGVNGAGIANSTVLKYDILDDAVTQTDPILMYDGAALNIAERTTGNGGSAMWDVITAGSTINVDLPNTTTIVQCTGVPSLALKLRKVNQYFTELQCGVVADGSDQVDNIQACFDYMETGDTLEFLDSAATYSINEPLSLMANVDWKNAYSATNARSGLTIKSSGAKVQFMDTVPFIAIFPDMPIENWSNGNEAIQSRQPNVLIVGNVDDFKYEGLDLDGNMQARGTNLGLPTPTEQEHCLSLIGCYGAELKLFNTFDSMGDGIYIGYPYLNDAGSSQFRGVTSLDGLNYDIVISDTKHYRHSRNGVSLVGCVRVSCENIYSEQINAITNYTSVAGPGTTIDIEYDISLSFYNSLGFSLAKDIIVDGVSSTGNIYGGTIQVQNGRNIQISKVRHEGGSIFGFGRIEGDATTPDGAKNVSIDDVIMSGTGSMVFYARLSGENVTLTNVTLSEGLTFSSGFFVPHPSHNLTIDGVRGDVVHSDVTGTMLEVADQATGLSIKNWDITVLATSAGVRNPILFDGSCEGRMDNIKITAPDSVPMSALERGVFHCLGTGVNVDCTDIIADFKTPVLVSQALETDVNKFSFKRGYARGMVFFPSVSAFTKLCIESFKVASCYNTGSASASMLHLRLKSDQTIELKDISSNSDGTFGFNKAKSGGRIITAETDFANLTDCSVTIDGMMHTGGRDTDGKYDIFASADSVAKDDLWFNQTILDFFSFNNININKSKSVKTTLTSGADTYALDTTVIANFSFYPNMYLNVQMLSSGSNGEAPNIEFYRLGATADVGAFNVDFQSNLTGNLDLLINTF